MHRAKAFFYVAAGVFLLALSYHLGARTATAQAPSGSVFIAQGAFGGRTGYFALTAAGDFYFFTYGQAFLGWQSLNDLSVSGDAVVAVLPGYDTDGHGGLFVLTRGGQVYFWSEGHSGEWRAHSSVGATSAATGLGPGDHGDGHVGMFAALENGDIYLFSDGHGSTWQYHSNIFSGPTAMQRESFGAMKSRYRGEREAARPTQDK
jgi:hypothetical protein